MSEEREFLEMARDLLKLAADAVLLAYNENPDRGSLKDIERDIRNRRESCVYLIDVIDNEPPARPEVRYGCPDGGACHHSCSLFPGQHCWRVHNAEPLSDVFPDDKWPRPLPLAVVPEEVS